MLGECMITWKKDSEAYLSIDDIGIWGDGECCTFRCIRVEKPIVSN